MDQAEAEKARVVFACASEFVCLYVSKIFHEALDRLY